MHKVAVAIGAISVVILGASIVAQQQAAPTPAAPIPAGLPDWAYTPPPPAGSPPPPSALPADDTVAVSIPGTTKTFTRGQLRAQKETMDWYPEDRHGTIPDIARFGKQGVRQCTLCHLPDGSGRPENAPISTYHPTYFMQQMQDFRDGLRKSADPRKANTNVMIGFAKATTREGGYGGRAMLCAASPAPHQSGRVEDRAKGAAQGRMHGCPGERGRRMVPIPAGGSSRSRTTICRPRPATRACWTAYVPPGTLNRGKQVAAKYQCATCHGADLGGIGPVPALAGRSPSYTMRQIFDMKTGARRGPWAELMKSIVTSMSVQDMMAVSAFAASTSARAAARRTTTSAAR